MRRRILAVALVLATASAPFTAFAQSADDDEAHALYDAGRRAFDAGRYDRALEHFHRAYELSPRAALLYNIAQSADRLRLDVEALDAFERYLASDEVDETLRGQIEGRIEVLRAAVAEQLAAPSDVTADATASAASPSSSGPDMGPAIALLVSGGVLVVAGGVLLGLAASENATLQGAPDASRWSDYAGHLDGASGLSIGGGVALGVGVVGCVIGSVLIAMQPSPATSVAVGPGSFSLRTTF